jgi:hypothetical protein
MSESLELHNAAALALSTVDGSAPTMLAAQLHLQEVSGHDCHLRTQFIHLVLHTKLLHNDSGSEFLHQRQRTSMLAAQFHVQEVGGFIIGAAADENDEVVVVVVAVVDDDNDDEDDDDNDETTMIMTLMMMLMILG